MTNNSSFQNQLKRVLKQEAGNVYVYICIDHTTITILASKKINPRAVAGRVNGGFNFEL